MLTLIWRNLIPRVRVQILKNHLIINRKHKTPKSHQLTVHKAAQVFQKNHLKINNEHKSIEIHHLMDYKVI